MLWWNWPSHEYRNDLFAAITRHRHRNTCICSPIWQHQYQAVY